MKVNQPVALHLLEIRSGQNNTAPLVAAFFRLTTAFFVWPALVSLLERQLWAQIKCSDMPCHQGPSGGSRASGAGRDTRQAIMATLRCRAAVRRKRLHYVTFPATL